MGDKAGDYEAQRMADLTTPKVAITDMVSVPREPTEAMLDAAHDADMEGWTPGDDHNDFRRIYKAMLAASPQPSDERVLAMRPVAWRCKDYADGWIIFQDEQAAYKYHEQTDCTMQGLYVRDEKHDALDARSRDSAIRAEAVEEAAKEMLHQADLCCHPDTEKLFRLMAQRIRSLAQPKPECSGYQAGEEHE